jgi:hypothetical protein
MATTSPNRLLAIGVGVAPLLGLLISVLTSDVSDWTFFTWMFAAFALMLSAMAFFYAATARDIVGQLPSDPNRVRRLKTLSQIGIGAMVFVFILEIGSALTGSWGPTDGMFLGFYSALALLLFGRLNQIREREAVNP